MPRTPYPKPPSALQRLAVEERRLKKSIKSHQKLLLRTQLRLARLAADGHGMFFSQGKPAASWWTKELDTAVGTEEAVRTRINKWQRELRALAKREASERERIARRGLRAVVL